MSDTKWTPGPYWLGDIDDSVIGSGFTDIHAETHGGIASVVTRMTDYNESEPWHARKRAELLANVNLFVAAPDLYEALDQAVTSMQDSGYSNNHLAVVAARAALAKARGE